jgi:hypothetical protein
MKVVMMRSCREQPSTKSIRSRAAAAAVVKRQLGRIPSSDRLDLSVLK